MSTEKFVKRGKKLVIDKDPQAILDYSIELINWMAEGDIVTGLVVDTTGGLVVEDSSYTDNKLTAWLSGGTLSVPGAPYASATYRFTTLAGRQDDRTLYFKIVHR